VFCRLSVQHLLHRKSFVYFNKLFSTNGTKSFVMSFAVGFKPFAEMHTAHHMLMFGCQTPGENLFAKDKKYWYVLNTLMKI